MGEGRLIVILCSALAALVFVILFALGHIGHRGQTWNIWCDTKGATLNHTTSPDRKKTTFYCLKDGKLVP